MKKRLYLVISLILISLFLVSNVYGLTCEYSKYPNLDKPIKWLCTLNNSQSLNGYYCMAYSYDENGSLINANPKIVNLNSVGSVSYFYSFPAYKTVQLVNIEFDTFNILPNRNITLSVICKSDTDTKEFNRTVIPIYKQLTEPADLIISIKNNAFLFTALFFVFFFLVFIFIKIYLFYKNG